MKVVLPIVVIVSLIVFLVFSAVEESSKQVRTVSSLKSEGVDRKRIRLGARVSNKSVSITDPQDGSASRNVVFYVIDPPKEHETYLPQGQTQNFSNADEIRVVYKGVMPDTLKEGRDVILEGDFLASQSTEDTTGTFYAHTLNTQCPSKYKPPKPGEEEAE